MCFYYRFVFHTVTDLAIRWGSGPLGPLLRLRPLL